MKKKNQLYLECYTGISGDMTVAALLDLGADERILREALASLPVDGFEIKIGRVKKSGLDACDFNVVLDHTHENHDHDMEYLHGASQHYEGDYHHEDDHHHESDRHHGDDYHHEDDHHYEGDHNRKDDHHHEDTHHHNIATESNHGREEIHSNHHDESHSHNQGHGHNHEHRGMREIRAIIGQSAISDHAKETALRIFEILGEAEAKAHGEMLETVHFHEVGAVDSIVDIVAAAVCLDNLGIDEVIVPFLCEGGGTIRCAHGILPVPVPAVANIVAAHGLKLRLTGEEAEYVTPTGAAIAAAIRTSDRLPKEFTAERIGLGAGKRNYRRPGLLRAMLIQEVSGETGDSNAYDNGNDAIWKLESNIDDTNGENFGYVMEKLLEAGARDVFYSPVYMKKNRPAYMLSVLCMEKDIEVMEHIIFRETTTIGIRRNRMERTVLKRQIETIQTPFGEATVKICKLPRVQSGLAEKSEVKEEVRCYPEYESVARLCRECGRSYREVYDIVCQTYRDKN